MAFGTEMVLLLGAGFVVLGPKRMQSMIGQIGRAKAQFDKASRALMTEVSGGLQQAAGAPASAKADNFDDRGLVLPDELIERIASRSTT